jgi:hypothetical protein
MNREEVIAAACQQAGYTYAFYALGEIAFTWDDAPASQKSSMLHAVRFWDVLDPALPLETLCEASHVAWLNFKLREGWKLGPVKDLAKKESPNLVPYQQLPEAQRKKDEVVVRTYLTMRALLPPAV